MELSIPIPGRDMRRDFAINCIIIAVTIAAAALLIVAQSLRFPVSDLWTPLGVTAALAGAAWYYRMQGADRLVAALTALMFLTLYAVCFAVMLDAGTVIGMPFIDELLVRIDAACGVSVLELTRWSHSHPGMELALQWSYTALIWQTPLVIVVLSLMGELKSLRQFVLQFMLATWICALFFFVLPAAGPFTVFDFEPSAAQARYLRHLHELRDGTRTVVTWHSLAGLTILPLFHTTWAMLLAWALRRRVWLFLPGVLLNAAVIAAAMTTGWCYFAEVLAGAAIGLSTIFLSSRRTSESRAELDNRDSQVEIRLSELSKASAERVRSLTEKGHRADGLRSLSE